MHKTKENLEAVPKRAPLGITRIGSPIITWPMHEDMVPDWLKKQIIKDRFQAKDNPEPLATDSEALAYLIGASLSMPLDSDWSSIYFHCFTKVMDSARKAIPPDLRKEDISQYEQQLLNRLKAWLYKKTLELGKKKRPRAVRETDKNNQQGKRDT